MKKQILFTITAIALYTGALAQNNSSDTIRLIGIDIPVKSTGGVSEVTFSQGNFGATSILPIMYAQQLWMSGLDSLNQLVLTGETYRQREKFHQPGPISQNPDTVKYNRVWKITSGMIDSLKNGLYATLPEPILNWPAHGNQNNGETGYLAPFFDADNDGWYNPFAGDYPCIKGDQAILFIYNDQNPNRYGDALNVDVVGLVYTYNSGSFFDSTYFVELMVLNKGQGLQSFRGGIFTDFDLPFDELVGTDINRNLAYAYYGTTPSPIFFPDSLHLSMGVVMLEGYEADPFDGIDNNRDGCVDGIRDANGNCLPENPANGLIEKWSMSSNIYYINSGDVIRGNPIGNEYNNYLHGRWRNGDLMRITNPSGFLSTANGNGVSSSTNDPVTTFAFPGNTYDSTQTLIPHTDVNWFGSPFSTEDKRVVTSFGDRTVQNGDFIKIAYATTFVTQDTALSSDQGLTKLFTKTDEIIDFWNNQQSPDCAGMVLSKTEVKAPSYTFHFYDFDRKILVLHNPSVEQRIFTLYDMTGQKVAEHILEQGQRVSIPMNETGTSVYALVVSGTPKAEKVQF